MMRRRQGLDSPPSHRRTESDFAANGENGHVSNGHATPGSVLCCGAGGVATGKSPLRRISNGLRARLRQALQSLASCHDGRSSGQGDLFGALGFLGACLLMVWLGLQLPPLLRKSVSSSSAQSGVDASSRRMTVQRQALEGRQEEDEAGPTLAYGIMVYQRKGNSVKKTLGQFTRMFDAIYDEKNTYVVHVDMKSDAELLMAISAIVAETENLYEVPSVSVSWAGITVVERTLALMQKAVEVDDSWRFFVNLGHEDYPSTSQAQARRWLKGVPDGTNFIKCWPIEGHDFFGQFERHDARVKDVHVDDFMGGVKEYRTLSGKPGSQERPQSEYKFYKSLQQTMLSRQLSEYAVQSSEARRLLLYMGTAKAPDELYFPTLTQLDPRFATMATCTDTRHYSYWIRPGGSWHPEYLTLDHLPLVLNATEFYIRKVDEAQGSGPLLQVLDLLRSGTPLEETLPILKDWLNRDDSDGRPLGTGGGPIIEFTDGTVEDAIAELYRRQSEEVEAKKAQFLSYIRKRRTRAQRVNTESGGSPDGPPRAKQPFHKKSNDNVKSFLSRKNSPRASSFDAQDARSDPSGAAPPEGGSQAGRDGRGGAAGDDVVRSRGDAGVPSGDLASLRRQS